LIVGFDAEPLLTAGSSVEPGPSPVASDQRIRTHLDQALATAPVSFDGATIALERTRPPASARTASPHRPAPEVGVPTRPDAAIEAGPFRVQLGFADGELLARSLIEGISTLGRLGLATPPAVLNAAIEYPAQLAQLLRSAGVTTVVSRLRLDPRAEPTTRWQAPDRSTVELVECPDEASDRRPLGASSHLLEDRIDAASTSPRPRVLAVSDRGGLRAIDLVLAVGLTRAGDRERLTAAVAEIRRRRPDLDLALGGWGQVHTRPGTRSRELAGPLIAHDAIDLGSLLSTRPGLRHANAVAQHRLVSIVEPLDALLAGPRPSIGRRIRQAWSLLTLNSAATSIGLTERLADLRAAEDNARRALTLVDELVASGDARLALTAPTGTHLALNLDSRPRSGPVAISRPDSEPILDGEQVLERTRRRIAVPIAQGPGAPAQVERIVASTEDAVEAEIGLTDNRTAVVTIRCNPKVGGVLPTGEIRSTLERLVAQDVSTQIHVELDRPAVRRSLVHVNELPGFGHRLVDPADAQLGSAGHPAPVEVEAGSMSNGLVSLTVDSRSGCWSINGHDGFGRLLAECDDGDLANSVGVCPAESDHTPKAVNVKILERGPIRGRLAIDRIYDWPDGVIDHKVVRRSDVEVRTIVEVEAGSGAVRVCVEMTEACMNQRLRVLLPLPERPSDITADRAFGSLRRKPPTGTDGSDITLPSGTGWSHRWVHCGGLTVAHLGVHQHEVIEGVTRAVPVMALTLLRSPSRLTRDVWGSDISLDDPGLAPAPTRFEFALGLETNGDTASPDAMFSRAYLPLRSVAGTGAHPTHTPGRLLEIDKAHISSVRRKDEQISVRLLNDSTDETKVDLGRHQGHLTDLLGNRTGTARGSLTLAPHRIADLELDP